MKRTLAVSFLIFCCLLTSCGKKVDRDSVAKGNGIYFMFNNYLHYYDEDLGKAIPLCFNAACDHKPENAGTCTAFKSTNYEGSGFRPEGATAPKKDANHWHIDCVSGEIWTRNENIYMIEYNKNDAKLVSYDRYGNNKKDIKVLIDRTKDKLYDKMDTDGFSRYLGPWLDMSYSTKIIGDYLYYVVSTRAGIYEDYPFVYPEVFDRAQTWHPADPETPIEESFEDSQIYIELYRVALDGSSEPEKLSDPIFMDILYWDYNKKMVMLNGNEEDGITVTFSSLMTTQPSDFDDICEVHHIDYNGKKLEKVADFNEGMFEGEIRWKYTANIDNRGRVFIPTVKSIDADRAEFRIYVYNPMTKESTLLFQEEGKKADFDDDLVIRRIYFDGTYIYLQGASENQAYIKVYDYNLKEIDTLNVDVNLSPYASPFYYGFLAFSDQSIIFVTANTADITFGEGKQAVQMSDAAKKLYYTSYEEGNDFNYQVMEGAAYTMVMDKSCIGTGHAVFKKLFDYPYAGYY